MDILQKLYDGRISIDDAHDLLEPGGEAHSYEELGLSEIEATAFLYGTGIDDIARWRYEGWPKECSICGLKLPRLNEGGWFTGFSTEHGTTRIVHLECLYEEKE